MNRGLKLLNKKNVYLYEINNIKSVLNEAIEFLMLTGSDKGDLCLLKDKSIKKTLEIKNSYKNGYVLISSFRDIRNFDYENDKYLPVAIGATGLDYHIRMKYIIKKLCINLETEYYYQVDNGDLPERKIAELAKTGEIGLNHCFYHKELGSFVSLGLIFTNEKIENYFIDKLLPNSESFLKCSSCRKCITNCPTKALINKKYNECLSYLLQSKKDTIFEYKNFVNKSIYGCDICQINCSYNIKILRKKNFLGRKIAKINIDDLIFMSNKKFKKKYANNSFSWRGKRILLRNALIYGSNRNKPLKISKEGIKIIKNIELDDVKKSYDLYINKFND